ncbi:hypothetical protein HYV79_01670 [Candidatus Woesearchaeota archaeon]|nr:hypothetical protein [Candidatus Woesearchaeota archaeon]
MMIKRQRQLLVDFVQSAKGFEHIGKLKLILIAAGVKPATYVALKINKENLGELTHFRTHLKKSGLLFAESTPKSYEVIKKIKDGVVEWELGGTWYGFDIFQNKRSQDLFKEYQQTVRQNHEKADEMGGKAYGYPDCCIKQYVKEHNLRFLKKNYTYYKYYFSIRERERSFPFLTHTPCSKACKSCKQWNKHHQVLLKKIAPKFLKEYTKKRKIKTECIVDNESDVYENKLQETKSLWPKKDGYEFSFITRKAIEGQHYLIAYLTKKKFERGAVVDSILTLQYRFADVKISKAKKSLPFLEHRRYLPLLKK